MAIDQKQRFRERASRGKYQRLYTYLCGLPTEEWRTSFSEIERILGFSLPNAARDFRPWWANQKDVSSRAQALAWSAAGWETAEVDMIAETLLFRRRKGDDLEPLRSLDEILPPHPTAVWPEGLSLRREDMYEDRI